jgi:SAM-dependent methyltransferase
MVFGADIRAGSMLSNEQWIVDLHSILRSRRVLEIGTLHGLSAALWAQFAEHVTTIDIHESAVARRIWDKLGVANKITYRVVKSNDEKRKTIAAEDFDFAFVDGDHSHTGAKIDFACVERCGAVLFHDYKPDNWRFRGLVKFIDSLRPLPFAFGPPSGRFALWLAHPKPNIVSELETRLSAKKVDPSLNGRHPIDYVPILPRLYSLALLKGWWPGHGKVPALLNEKPLDLRDGPSTVM